MFFSIGHFSLLPELGLDGRKIVPSVLRALRELIPADYLFFFWTDEEGELQGAYEDPAAPDGVHALYFGEFHNRQEAEALPRFADTMRAGPDIFFPDFSPQAVRGTAFYERIVRPLNSRYPAVIVLRDGARCLGMVVFHRTPAMGPFTPDEVSMLRDIRHCLVQALTVTPRPPGLWVSDRGEGLLILDRQGRLQHHNPESVSLIQMLSDARTVQALARPTTTLPMPVTAVHRCLHEQWLGMESPSPETTMHNVWGRFRLRAHPLAEAADGIKGVTIRREIPLRLRVWESLPRQPLTPRQRELCFWLAGDFSYQDIAVRMGISRHTVIEYMQEIYAKLDVRGREALLANLIEYPENAAE